MKNLPNRIFLNLRHTWQVKKGNKCLPDDFVQLRDDCGECITHTLGEPNHEDDPEYILNDKSEFVPEEWGWEHHDNMYVEKEKFSISTFRLYQHDYTRECEIIRHKGIGQGSVEIYSGPLTPTLYRLIAEANGIPIPAGK